MHGDHPFSEPDPDALASGDNGSDRATRKARRRAPRKMTADRMRRIALAYLDRYEASEQQFRAMLMRRATRAAQAHGDAPGDFVAMVDAEVAHAVEAGYINNRRFAENQVSAQRGRGASARHIAGRLRARGVVDDDIDAALAADERDDPQAAERYAQRRRLGPYRTKDRETRRDRDVAALVRAGFSFRLAASIIDRAPDDELGEEPGDGADG
ncbi:MAG: RecX family transcriptional regulator [Devosiaceae bacterium]|nr:RecX family transcriptional regulator [Devosiaceae bacterium MH13]